MKSPSESDKQSSTDVHSTMSNYGVDDSSMGISRTSEMTEDSDSSKFQNESRSERSKRKRKRKGRKKQSEDDPIEICLSETTTEILLFM